MGDHTEYAECFKEFAHLMGRRFKRTKMVSMDFQPKKGIIDVDYKTTHFTLKLPRYILAKDKVSELLSAKQALLQELGTLRHRMLSEEQPSQEDIAAFTAKAQEVDDVNSMLEDLRGRLGEQRQRMGQAMDAIQQRIVDAKRMQAPLLEEMAQEPDDGIRSQRMTQYLEVGLEGNVAEACRELKEAKNIRYLPERIMVKTPSCKRRKGAKAVPEAKAKVDEPDAVEPKAKEKVKAKAPKVKSEAKEKAKAKLAKDILEESGFKFKTKEECMSRKRLANYYMSKDDMLDLIQKTPTVLEHMPKGFKAMSKEGLCDILFTIPDDGN